MNSLYRRALTFLSSPAAYAGFLLALCLLAYAPLLPRLGFYWDDFPIAWIASTMGGEGLARYFSTNRPVWGLLYQMTTPVLGSQPLNWQIFALLLRWMSGLAFWGLLRLVWAPGPLADPRRKAFAAWAAALFVLYPGFQQQFISFVYSHFFIVLIAFLGSLSLMVLALRLPDSRRRWYVPLTGAALLLSLFNVLAMEYFFLLDLLRPVLIWLVLGEQVPDRRARLRRTLAAWLPYLAVLAGAAFWRSVLFGFQTYQPALLSRLRANPLQAVGQLLPVVLADAWKTTGGAWIEAFTLPDAAEIGARYVQRYWILLAVGGVVSLVFFLLHRPGADSAQDRQGQRWAWQPVLVGAFSLLLAGGPFWLTDLEIWLIFPNDRFTLPFMPGASLFAAGLLTLLPGPRWPRITLLALGLAFAVGLHFQTAVIYNRDWSVQRSMLWQMTWRMPGLQPDTALLINELPVTYYTDNSLTAPLNWTFDPNNDPRRMKYVLLYPTLRKNERLSGLRPNKPVVVDYLATEFHGSTLQLLAFYYEPPGCLRVLDPEVDVLNWMVPQYLRESLALSNTELILTESPAGQPAPRPPEHIYGAEIARGWCYYYQKADLARQAGDWQTVARLGDEAFALDDYPNDPLERFPFIEGYAHSGSWERAVELSRESYAVSPEVMRPMLCRLWERIADQVPDSAEKENTLQQIQAEMSCSFK